MTDTDQMVTWLRAAMDTAERDAEAAARAFPDWEFDDCVKEVRDVPNAGTVASIAVPEFGPHIARQSPAAVLRRITADRKILEDCDDVLHDFVFGAFRQLALDTIRSLAEGYGWAEARSTPGWPECMCTPSSECGNCWEKRQQETT